MNKLFAIFVTLIVYTHNIAQVEAQDETFEDLALNGMASFKQLRKEYFIGALYLETLSQNTDTVVNMPGKKRMEMRVLIDKWSRRSFAQHWNQAILINSSQDELEKYSEQILAFTNIPKKDLEANDRFIIDMDPEKGTTVYLGDQTMFNTSDSEFFYLLLSTWIGQRPPSTEFKEDVLTLPTDDAGTELLTNYESIDTPDARKKEIASWLKSDKTDSSESGNAGVAPPDSNADSNTKVTARRPNESSNTPEASAGVAAVAGAAIAAAPKPTLTLEKPNLGSSTPAPEEQQQSVAQSTEEETQPEPAANNETQTSKPEPKQEEPVVVANIPSEIPTTIEQISEREQAQEKLMKNYRSNVLKLTYLNTQYPKRAMDLKQEGLVVLKVTLSRKGKLLDVAPETRSKHNLLNKAAQNAVKKSAPFPAAPSGLDGPKIELSLPFNFKL